eukprot:44366_1
MGNKVSDQTAENDKSYELNIKTLTAKILNIKCEANVTVAGVKDVIQDKEGLPQTTQRIIYNGKQLEDAIKLSDYNVPKNGTLLLVLRRSGIGNNNATNNHNKNEIYLTFLVNGAHYKKYTLNKNISVKEITKMIYNDCNLSEFGFPAASWLCRIDFKYIANNDTPISSYNIRSSPITVTNGLWPQLPKRSYSFNVWLHGNTPSYNMPKLIGYPVTLMNGQYRMMDRNDRLRFSTVWLDIDVAKQLIKSNIIDINIKDENYKQTPLNLLCQGNMYSNLSYNENEWKWLELIKDFCENDNINIETVDHFGQTPLINAINNEKEKIVEILLRYGAVINENIKEKMKNDNGLWIGQTLNRIRKEYIDSITNALLSYQFVIDSNHVLIIVNYCVCCDEN